jgi:hypothetical protein
MNCVWSLNDLIPYFCSYRLLYVITKRARKLIRADSDTIDVAWRIYKDEVL